MTKLKLCTVASNAPAALLPAQVTVLPPFDALRRILLINGLVQREDRSKGNYNDMWLQSSFSLYCRGKFLFPLLQAAHKTGLTKGRLSQHRNFS